MCTFTSVCVCLCVCVHLFVCVYLFLLELVVSPPGVIVTEWVIDED